MPSTTDGARALARRLIELEESRPRSNPTAESAPLEACYRFHLVLCTWVGSIGCNTLVARALRTAEVTHPALQELSAGTGARPFFDNVPRAIEKYDAHVVAAGIEAFLGSLLELLVRFMGADIVAALAEQTADPESSETTEPSDTS